jgi:hypothetical protein
MKPILKHALFVFSVLLLVSCAQLGVPAPQTFNEKLAAGYGAVTQVRTTATTLLEAKKISSDDAHNVLVTTDAARQGLDVARSLSKTDTSAAEGKVNAIRTTLTALAGYLATRSK